MDIKCISVCQTSGLNFNFVATPQHSWVIEEADRSYFMLIKSLHELRHAAILWYERLAKTLENLGLNYLSSNECIFKLCNEDGTVFLLAYANLLLIGTEQLFLKAVQNLQDSSKRPISGNVTFS